MDQFSSHTMKFLRSTYVFTMQILAIAVVGIGIWMSTHHDRCRRSLTLPVLALWWVFLDIDVGFMILAIAALGFGIWMCTHHDECRRSLTLPVLELGVSNHVMLYLDGNFSVHGTSSKFIVSNNGSGQSVAGLRYKEYQLQDYSSWFLKQLNNTEKWKCMKSCPTKANDCNNLPKKYKAKINRRVSASYYDLSFHPVSSKIYCKHYKNSHGVKCYNYASCKAGVAKYMKMEWRVVGIFIAVLFASLIDNWVLGASKNTLFCSRLVHGTRHKYLQINDQNFCYSSIEFWDMDEQCKFGKSLDEVELQLVKEPNLIQKTLIVEQCQKLEAHEKLSRENWPKKMRTPASDPPTGLTEVPPHLPMASDPVLPIFDDPTPLCRSSRPHKPLERDDFTVLLAN
ncbi:hypothetical protein RJ641_001183 [Dillenia turbinata]|uniref:Uncharacterized protein n=1 Tax=Dillenia turbinata TaxID=194707 RepID=A0AAN8W9N3_9MAGN